MSTREEEEDTAAGPEQGHPRPQGGMTSLTRVRAGGVRLIRSRRGRIWMLLAIAGPGVVAANAGNDAAGIATYASAGSQFVYRTLFFMVLVTFALVLVQEMAVRLGTHTGKGLAALIREAVQPPADRGRAVLRAAGQHRAGGVGIRRDRRGI